MGKILNIVFLLFIVSGCFFDEEKYRARGGHLSPWTPRPAFLSMPDGDDSYSQGFRDGCTTYLGAAGASGLRMAHGYAYDANRGIEDRDYYIGYRMGVDHCTYYVDIDPL